MSDLEDKKDKKRRDLQFFYGIVEAAWDKD
jgi:hypothetical protein